MLHRCASKKIEYMHILISISIYIYNRIYVYVCMYIYSKMNLIPRNYFML